MYKLAHLYLLESMNHQIQCLHLENYYLYVYPNLCLVKYLILPPTLSESLDNSFIKLILVARKAFAPYLIISEDCGSVLTVSYSCPAMMSKFYLVFLEFLAIRTDNNSFQFIKSNIALPSLKNSGLEPK